MVKLEKHTSIIILFLSCLTMPRLPHLRTQALALRWYEEPEGERTWKYSEEATPQDEAEDAEGAPAGPDLGPTTRAQKQAWFSFSFSFSFSFYFSHGQWKATTSCVFF